MYFTKYFLIFPLSFSMCLHTKVYEIQHTVQKLKDSTDGHSVSVRCLCCLKYLKYISPHEGSTQMHNKHITCTKDDCLPICLTCFYVFMPSSLAGASLLEEDSNSLLNRIHMQVYIFTPLN
jgi:hypothetical protein